MKGKVIIFDNAACQKQKAPNQKWKPEVSKTSLGFTLKMTYT